MDVTMAPVAVRPGWEGRLLRPSSFENPDLRRMFPGDFDAGAFDTIMRRRKIEGAENARVGYYSVVVGGGGVRKFQVELTVDEGSAWHRYSLPDDKGINERDEEYLVVVDVAKTHMDWGTVSGGFIRVVSPTVLEGMRVSSAWARDRTVFFRIQLSRPFDGAVVVRGDGGEDEGDGGKGDSSPPLRRWVGGSGGRCIEAKGGCNVAFLKYSAADIDGLVARVAISYTSLDAAAAALRVGEGLSFDDARASAERIWREVLSKVRVEGGDDRSRRVLYTALYHSMIHPTVHTDVGQEDDGGRAATFMGPDRKVHSMTEVRELVGDIRRFYSTISVWDIFRAQFPLLTLLHRDVARDVALSTLVHAILSSKGVLPVWPLAGHETWTMPGYHASCMLAEAINKGLISDPKVVAMTLHHAIVSAKYHAGKYFDLGYMPVGGTAGDSGPASTTLEHAFDDWCLAEIAKAAGNQTEDKRFRRRSVDGYRAIFDAKVGFFRGRTASGSWVGWPDADSDTFDPDYSAHRGGLYTEGTAHLWRWFVPHDPSDLARLLGGEKEAEKLLSDFFFPREGRASVHGASASLSDLTGQVGHYAHGNEPAHHAPFLFNVFNNPRKTQFLVRRLLREMYTDGADGIPGNDDCGQMSAWFVLAGIGMYPINPASGLYQITTPLFPKSTLDLGDGVTFVIDAPGADDESTMYIERAELYGKDGKLRRRVYDARSTSRREWEQGRLEITHEEIMAGGRLWLKLKPADAVGGF